MITRLEQEPSENTSSNLASADLAAQRREGNAIFSFTRKTSTALETIERVPSLYLDGWVRGSHHPSLLFFRGSLTFLCRSIAFNGSGSDDHLLVLIPRSGLTSVFVCIEIELWRQVRFVIRRRDHSLLNWIRPLRRGAAQATDSFFFYIIHFTPPDHRGRSLIHRAILFQGLNET